MKKYQVSITASDIEAKNESDAIYQFEELVKEGVFDEASYEVEEEEGSE